MTPGTYPTATRTPHPTETHLHRLPTPPASLAPPATPPTDALSLAIAASKLDEREWAAQAAMTPHAARLDRDAMTDKETEEDAEPDGGTEMNAAGEDVTAGQEMDVVVDEIL